VRRRRGRHERLLPVVQGALNDRLPSSRSRPNRADPNGHTSFGVGSTITPHSVAASRNQGRPIATTGRPSLTFLYFDEPPDDDGAFPRPPPDGFPVVLGQPPLPPDPLPPDEPLPPLPEPPEPLPPPDPPLSPDRARGPENSSAVVDEPPSGK
jgi:hypothetical protein